MKKYLFLIPIISLSIFGYLLVKSDKEMGARTFSPNLSNLSDVNISSASNGELLKYDGSNWVNIATSTLGITGAGITAGNALTLTGSEMNFDGGATPAGSLGGTWASPTIDDLFLLNNGDIGTGVYDFGGATSFEIPNSATLTTNATGQIGVDTTSGQLRYNNGSATSTISNLNEKCFTVEAPTADDDNVPIWSPRQAITITDLFCRTQAATSTEMIISDGTNAMETVTCDTDGQADDGTPTNNTFTANELVEFDTGTVTGTVGYVNMCITYSIDAD